MPERRDVGGFLLAHNPVDLQGGGGGIETNTTSIFNYGGSVFNFPGFQWPPDPCNVAFPLGPKIGDVFYDYINNVFYYYSGDPGLGTDGWVEIISESLDNTEPSALLTLTANQTIVQNGEDVLFDGVEFNDGLTANDGCCCDYTGFTIPTGADGTYIIVGQAVFKDGTAVTDTRSCRLHVNSNIVAENKNTGSVPFADMVQVTYITRLSAGDTVKMSAFHDDACDKTIGTHATYIKTFLGITRISEAAC